MPNVSITGNGSLVLIGGDGGNGGCGIKATNIAMAMGLNGFVKAYGGTGGKGGAPGRNGNAITGPIYTDKWKDCYGKNGNTGSAYLGNILTFGGTFIY